MRMNLKEVKEKCTGVSIATINLGNEYSLTEEVKWLVEQAEEVAFYKDLYERAEKERSDWVKKFNDESIQKTKYRCAFEALFEKISQK
jgi:DNA/RNA-binding domain of Phe-tRNA-synthetase-like protein